MIMVNYKYKNRLNKKHTKGEILHSRYSHLITHIKQVTDMGNTDHDSDRICTKLCTQVVVFSPVMDSLGSVRCVWTFNPADKSRNFLQSFLLVKKKTVSNERVLTSPTSYQFSLFSFICIIILLPRTNMRTVFFVLNFNFVSS